VAYSHGGQRWERAHPTSAIMGLKICKDSKSFLEGCMERGGITSVIYATADEAVAYMFYRCFLPFVFSVHQKIWDNRSWERLNGFS